MRAGKRLVYSETVCIFSFGICYSEKKSESRNVRFEKGIDYHEGKRRVRILEHEGIGI